ncbi:MAG: hypothetical protein ABI347_11490 [Nitrososphaera sp.]|jgi:uncharacterized membrane protein YkoI
MTNNLVSKKVLVPAAIAVAVALVVLAVPPAIAAASSGQGMAMGQMPKINGTVNAGQAMKDYINENVKVTLSQASDTAAKQVSNGRAVAGHLGVVQGYLVYTVFVVDGSSSSSSQQGSMVIVDAGNGSVLYKSEAMAPLGPFGGPMFGHGGWHAGGPGKWHGFGPGMWHDAPRQ